MGTNAWYQALGIYGYRHQSYRQADGVISLTVAHHGAELRCPHCNGTNIIRRGFIHRVWHAPPVGLHPVVVSGQVPRVECRRCNSTHVVPVPFASPGRSYTHSFERMVLELRRSMTLKDVARHMGVSDWTVRDIEKRWLGRRFKKPKLKHLKRLAIDEISIRKGHVYITLVLDLESGAVVFVGDGKGADALNPFWKRLKASHAKVEAVAMDLSAAYRLAVTTHLPEAAIVFDWFHIVKLLNDKLTALRRDLYRNATDKEQRQVLKGIRWLIIKRSENLNDDKDESERLDEALSLNAPLALAYYLKEELEWVFQENTKARARRFLEDWIERARATGLSQLKTFAKTLETHAEGILSWFDHPISTGPLEGTNNKIKTMKRQAYGYRDQEYFKLRILAIHESSYRLIG
jgi:transposase